MSNRYFRRTRVVFDVNGCTDITEFWNRKGHKVDVKQRGTWFGYIWSDGLITQDGTNNMVFERADIVVFSDSFDWHIEVSIDMNIYKAFDLVEAYCAVAHPGEVSVQMLSTLEDHLAKRLYLSQLKIVPKRSANDLTQKKLF